jgi:2-polyprenyl-6-methoxyphenol hydroxylase-like FAD-dependent oxidoreductase
MSHAIVIGGSIAGLTAAQVLSQHFDKVTIIDRDQVSDKAEVRKGVPQGYHAHIILQRGLDIMEQHFPGLYKELHDATARPVNFGTARFFMLGRWRPNYESSVKTIACSRPMLESTIYRRMLKNPRVTIMPGMEVVGLCVDASGTRATGINLRARHPQGGADRESSLEGDLIVDTSGRDSHAPDWLKSVGFPTPDEVTVNAMAGYASRIFEPPTSHKDIVNPTIVIQPSAPLNKRGCVLLPMENGLWQTLLLGAGGDYPPTDEEGFMEYARSLPDPAFYDAIKDAKPVSPIYGYRRTENRIRHYDKLPRHLENFLLMGDSVCCFNPIYGQGMSVASMESLTLDTCLRDHLKSHAAGDFKGLATTFQKKIAAAIAMPWQLASGEDLRWVPDHKPTLPERFMQWYVQQVLQATLSNQAVTEVFYRVQNMMDTPMALFRPDVMARVFITRLTAR